jgi:hypothetical protein
LDKGELKRGKSFWKVKIPQSCTWSWRKILKLRDTARKFIKFKVGGIERIFHLWLDWWHLDGVLSERYGHRVVYDVHSKVVEAR